MVLTFNGFRGTKSDSGIEIQINTKPAISYNPSCNVYSVYRVFYTAAILKFKMAATPN